jgi:hypothetical protein
MASGEEEGFQGKVPCILISAVYFSLCSLSLMTKDLGSYMTKCEQKDKRISLSFNLKLFTFSYSLDISVTS